jgi:inorganic pyrophosphatase
MQRGFSVAYRAGCVMGFSLTSLGLLVITILIAIYTNLYVENDYTDYTRMFECLAGYGLGGSTVALFGRVGGGIFTKAADVGADLVGKVESNLPEDSPNNPATIADNVGDNVGDIAGMGSDLFGSFAESTCAALVVGSSSPTFYYQPAALYYPLLITAFGIIVSLFTTFLAHNSGNKDLSGVTKSLSIQLLVSTLLATPALWFAGYISLPDRIFFAGIEERAPIHAWICCLSGLWSGLIIGYITEYYTSYEYAPV